ncbi:MAG: hypothetical protein LH609_16815 [Rudanella sp.]|nr:hypothetical protein [Rudanella sp.]
MFFFQLTSLSLPRLQIATLGFALFIAPLPIYAQTNTILHLKNGSALWGVIVGDTANGQVRLRTADRSEWVFARPDIARIERLRHPDDPALRYKLRGFVHYTELGPLATGNRASNGVTTLAFSFQITNGYKFGQWFYAGLGIGADLYAVQTFVPIVLSLRGDFTRYGDKIPFYFLEGGYSLNATSNDIINLQYRGGPTAAAGLGLKILFRRNTGFVIGVGYRFQRTETRQLSTIITEDINRLTLRAGFSF